MKLGLAGIGLMGKPLAEKLMENSSERFRLKTKPSPKEVCMDESILLPYAPPPSVFVVSATQSMPIVEAIRTDPEVVLA